MAQKTNKSIKFYLDTVERKKLAQIRAMRPEYTNLELGQIAHLELKEALFIKIREILKKKSATPDNYAAFVQTGYKTWSCLVRKLTIFLYKFQNKTHLYG